MIQTERQRRWWFATHPEYSSSRGGGRSHHDDDGDDDEASSRMSPEAIDAWADERLQSEKSPAGIALIEAVKFWLGTEFASKSPAEQHALLWDDEESPAAAARGFRQDSLLARGTDLPASPRDQASLFAQADQGTMNDAGWKELFYRARFPNLFDSLRDMVNYFQRYNPMLIADPNQPGKRLTDAAEIAAVAAQIARGHAYQKHVAGQQEFQGMKSPDEFERLIKRIISNPSEWKPLKNGRSAYWDKESGTVVVYDPAHDDKGTAFRPDIGKRYYNKNLE